MSFLDVERETVDQLLPGLDAALAELRLEETERAGNPAIEVFRSLGGFGLLVPRMLGGAGATPLQALRVQRAIGARSPSLAVASNMHHLTIASLIEIDPDNPGLEAATLDAVARRKLIIASGFAEGRPGGSIQTSALRLTPHPGGVLVNGRKRPCSLSRSMDLFSFSLPPIEGMDAGLAAVIIPADTPGIEWRPYWQSPILAGAESDEVILTDVFVPAEEILPLGGSGRSNAVQDRGFLWFELMIAGAYLGIASRLLELVLNQGRGAASARVSLAGELEAAMAALEGVARSMEAGERGNRDLARMMLVRYAVQDAIARATDLALEALGGAAFMASGEVGYLLAASRGLSLHPPSRSAAAERLAAHLTGADFVID
jgi:alkylation response protein AidB-like acyl-CoA dehydrogenase